MALSSEKPTFVFCQSVSMRSQTARQDQERARLITRRCGLLYVSQGHMPDHIAPLLFQLCLEFRTGHVGSCLQFGAQRQKGGKCRCAQVSELFDRGFSNLAPHFFGLAENTCFIFLIGRQNCCVYKEIEFTINDIGIAHIAV